MRKHNWLHLILSLIFIMVLLAAEFLIIKDLRQHEEIINQLNGSAEPIGFCSCEKEIEALRITKIRTGAKIIKKMKTGRDGTE